MEVLDYTNREFSKKDEYEYDTSQVHDLKSLQKYLNRYERLPNDVDLDDVFHNIASSLSDDVETRLLGLKVLNDLIPQVDEELDPLMLVVHGPVVTNLSCVVPEIKKQALNVILSHVKYTSDPENVLKNIISKGAETTNSEISSNVILSIPEIVKAVKTYSHSGTLSHSAMVHIITYFSKRMVQLTYQESVIKSMYILKKIVGETKFDHFMETYYPHVKRDFDDLCEVYNPKSDDEESDSFIENDDTLQDHSDSMEMSGSSDTLESKPEASLDSSDSDVIMKIYDSDGNEVHRTSSRKVTFGGEVVKIRTPDSDRSRSSDKVDIRTNITIQINDEEVEPRKHLPKVKVRSSHIPLPINPALSRPKDYKASFRQPQTCALDKTESDKHRGNDELSWIPNYDGVDSLTSSSDSSDQCKNASSANSSGHGDTRKEQVLINNALLDLRKLKINDQMVSDNLFKKDDWHLYIRGLDRLAVTLHQPEVIQSLITQNETSAGISLLCYLLNSLFETRSSQRITVSILRALKALCSAMLPAVLSAYLITLVPAICKYFNPSYNASVRQEATDCMKILMQKLSPDPVVNILLTEQCFFSSSSKMRENSLLCLMYSLMTFPSTEFNTTYLTDVLVKHSVKEPKKRVRQALLDCLSILAQYVPRSQFRVIGIDQESNAFKQALRSRLSRRQLPVVSPNGIILYAFQITPSILFGKDIEWIMHGKGSLSLNSCRGQFDFQQESTTVLPANTSNWFIRSTNRNIGNRGLQNTLRKMDPNMQSRASSEENFRSMDYEEFYAPENRYRNRYSAEWIDTKSTSAKIRETSRIIYNGEEEMRHRLTKIRDSSQTRRYFGSKLPIRHAQKNNSDVYNRNEFSSMNIQSESSSKGSVVPHEENNSDKDNMNNNNDSNNNIESNSTYLAEDSKKEIIEQSEAPTGGTFEQPEKDIRNSPKQTYGTRVDDETDFKIENGRDPAPLAAEELITEVKNDEKSAKETASVKEDKTVGRFRGIPCLQPKNVESNTSTRTKRAVLQGAKARGNFLVNSALPPFEDPKSGLRKTLTQLESDDWETIVEGLQGVIRLYKHHVKCLGTNQSVHIRLVSKHIRNLRSQVARAACVAAESIFKYSPKVSDQDMEDLANALFSKTADTNKFLREDSNKALTAMIENARLSRPVINMLHRNSNNPSPLVRSTSSRLLHRLVERHGFSAVMCLPKENRDMLLRTAAKFVSDGNLETRNHAKNTFEILGQDSRFMNLLSGTVPPNVMNHINKSLCRIAKR